MRKFSNYFHIGEIITARYEQNYNNNGNILKKLLFVTPAGTGMV